MSEPKWMARGDVEVIHEGVIEVGGGAHGLRDPRDLIRHDMAGQAPYDLEAGLLEGYAQLAAGNFRKRGMSEIIERVEREMREEDDA